MTDPPGDAKAPGGQPSAFRKTNSDDTSRVNPALAPVKSSVLDFVRHPTFEAFRRAFPHLSAPQSFSEWLERTGDAIDTPDILSPPGDRPGRSGPGNPEALDTSNPFQ
jgi:hypothetical protein